MMKIGIDLKPFSTGSKYRGIGHYSRELIRELLDQNDHEMEFHFLNLYQDYTGDPVLNGRCKFYQYPMGPRVVDVGELQRLRDPRTKNVIEGAVRHFIEQSNIDVMFFTSPTEYGNMYDNKWFQDVFTVGILYDLIPSIFPQQCLCNADFEEDYNRSIDFLKGLDLLLAISQSAKEDAVRLFDIPEEKIVVIYAGIDCAYRKLSKVNIASLKSKYGISDPFIMFAGGIDFKKNIEGLIVAYAKCGKSITNRYQLVIVGRAEPEILGQYLRIAKDHGVEGRVVCTGYIPKEDLIRMYNITELFTFPSFYEGFGLPVIEAMACGARVLTSNTSSLKEIAQGHATLVAPGSVRSIAKGIREILDHPLVSMKRAENSVEYAKSFQWKSVAQKVRKAILERWTPHETKEYSFEVTEQMVRYIAKLYTEEGILFDYGQQEDLADALIMIQNHQSVQPYDLNHRILFDMTVVHEWIKSGYMTGIARVSNELFKAMKKKMPIIPVIVQSQKDTMKCSEISTDTYQVINENIKLLKTDLFLMPEIQLRGIHVPIKHPYANEFQKVGIKTYAVVYDILPLKMPQYFEKRTSRGFSAYIKEIVNNYDGILCDSRCVADDVINYCKKHGVSIKNQVQVGYFPLGQNSFSTQMNHQISSEIIRFFEKNTDVYLMLGTIEPRKGHSLVLDAFESMWAEGKEMSLCIIGHIGWNMKSFMKRVKTHSEKGWRLEFFEAVNDSEVAYAYQHAKCLIQASAGEGFGLPLIEAGKYNLPVLCSDLEVFHEVAGGNVNYFERTTDALIKKIDEFEHGQAVYESSRISGYSWTQAADKVYQMIVNGQGWYQVIEGDKG